MESKSIKKSTVNQMQTLVDYMEDNPEFARGLIVPGSSRMSAEDHWIKLVKRLNSQGPPTRTIVEWKKSWADLKSRTKKKVAENTKSMSENGGGLYGMNTLTKLEQVVDRVLFLSKAAAPSGRVFGYLDKNSLKPDDSVENYFESLLTPLRSSKTREKQNNYPPAQPSQQEWQYVESEDDLSTCSSEKRRKTVRDEQIFINRRQLKVDEESAAIAKEQSDATKALTDATKALVKATKRIADAAEEQAEAARNSIESQTKMLTIIEAFTKELVQHFRNK